MAKGTLHLNVEFSAVADEEGKFGRLAALLGLADADHALGRCTHLWVACTRRGEAELPQWLVEQILGQAGPDALVEAELASWAGGRGDSKTRRLRIGGAEKHCLWMVGDQAAKQEQSSKGGKTRAATASRAGGRFTRTPGGDPPAQTSPSEITTASDLPEISLPRAIQPSTEQAPVPAAPPAAARPATGGDPEPANQPTREDRKAVRDAIRAEINAARARVGAKLGTPLHPVLPFDRGLDSDLNGQLALATTRADLDALAKQAMHAVAMAELEAIAEPDRVQFLTGAIFSGGNFARLAGKTAATARAGPKRGAARAEQPTIRPKTTDDEQPPIPSWE